MNPEAYVEMAATESRHWWFQARRKIVESTIKTMGLPAHARILEVGSGTGGNLHMLSQLGTVSAMEMSEQARNLSFEKTGGAFAIHSGSCPNDIPFEESQFDLICMFDVLEHIDEDVATLSALRKHLAPGGRMLITVPANTWLWSTHDVFLHHKRRYTAQSLRQAFTAGGLQIDRMTHFNTLLLPLAALGRLRDRLLSNKPPSGTSIPPRPINTILGAIFASERHILRHLNLPAGVSLLGITHAK